MEERRPCFGHGEGAARRRLVGRTVASVARVERTNVALDGQLSVNGGELGVKVWLVKVKDVLKVVASNATLKRQHRVAPDAHCDGGGTTRRAGRSLLVHGEIDRDDERILAVPVRAVDPVDGVEQRSGAAVARVDAVNALHRRCNLAPMVLLQHRQQERFDRLALVDGSLGTDLQAAQRAKDTADVTSSASNPCLRLKQLCQRGGGERYCVAVVANDAHLLLTEADGVLTCSDAVKGLGDALRQGHRRSRHRNRRNSRAQCV
mmetsp:Transcript_7877/g.25219  ORF Transcript_7877/g.25219 Transcript_7877/m.25219 type:complete len:262 (+) Transcript_7877:668-1453(+)